MAVAKLKQPLWPTLSVIALIALFILIVIPEEPMRKPPFSTSLIYTLDTWSNMKSKFTNMNDQSPVDECQCDLNDQYDFCYRMPADPETKGQRFNCEYAKHLDKLGLLLDKNVVDLETQDVPEPAFVTAMSDNHFSEGLTLVAQFRKVFPRTKLYVYDLGLQKDSVNELKEMCMVEVRQFNFKDYPSYVENLFEYRWKPLIIAQMLNEFGAIWYMDTSVRWKKDKRDMVYNEVTCRRSGIWKWAINLSNSATAKCKKSAYLLHYESGHGIFPTTHPGVYKYIPTDFETLENKGENYDANFAFAVKTVNTRQILKWYVLCALEKNCMAPEGAQPICDFGNDRFKEYAHCHRYDQSVINLLLFNANGYNVKNYVSSIGDGATIERRSENNLTKKDFLCNRTEIVE